MTKARSFKIFCPGTGLGLVKDARIIEAALKDLGYQVSVHTGQSYYVFIRFLFVKVKLTRLFSRLKNRFLKKNSVIVIHLERVCHQGLLLGDHNILIPNQEWCTKNVLNLLPYIDVLWCKSKLAVNIFSELNYRTDYIGFCTDLDPAIGHREGALNQTEGFFTRIGPSRNRGAEQLANLWSRHSEWPRLRMVVGPEYQPDITAKNIEYIDHIASDEDFNRLVNSVPFHIFLTEAEGFGHLIVESMSRGAIVLVTNASPMNEYATHESAILLSSYYAGQLHLSPRFHVNDEVIEAAVEKALSLSVDERIKLKEKAAGVNNELAHTFRARLSQAISFL